MPVSKTEVISLSTDLATKADDSAVIHTTGNESVGGTKTFTGALRSPDPVGNTDVVTKQYFSANAQTWKPLVDLDFTAMGNATITGDPGTDSGMASGGSTILPVPYPVTINGNANWGTINSTNYYHAWDIVSGVGLKGYPKGGSDYSDSSRSAPGLVCNLSNFGYTFKGYERIRMRYLVDWVNGSYGNTSAFRIGTQKWSTVGQGTNNYSGMYGDLAVVFKDVDTVIKTITQADGGGVASYEQSGNITNVSAIETQGHMFGLWPQIMQVGGTGATNIDGPFYMQHYGYGNATNPYFRGGLTDYNLVILMNRVTAGDTNVMILKRLILEYQ